MIKEKLEGKTLLGFAILEQGFCSMSLSDGYAISAETLCRYVGENGEFISSQDHGQMFGLTGPYDAAEKILGLPLLLPTEKKRCNDCGHRWRPSK